jgi:hypothetical protein
VVNIKKESLTVLMMPVPGSLFVLVRQLATMRIKPGNLLSAGPEPTAKIRNPRKPTDLIPRTVFFWSKPL